MANLKRLIKFLVLFSFVSVVCFGLVLFYFRRRVVVFVPETHILTLGNKTFSGIAKERVAKLLAKRIKASNKISEMAPTPSAVNLTLGTCPDNPPDLVGPLLIEFDFRRTWEHVRKEVSPLLQKGGRFKPKDCVAKQKVAIIIPFRNRHEHLKHWLYYLHPILKRQLVDYGVYVINQDGKGVFNRAKLMNAGYVEALKEYDYDCFLFSDVDLVPLDDRNLYRCFDNPRHLAIGMDKFKFDLPYKTFFGGVASLYKHQYLKINGFPNTYWGWGGEDDDIYKRIVLRGMQVSRPDLLTGRYRMIRHQRDAYNDPNPKNPDKLFQTHWTMNTDGINSLKYTVKNIEKDILYTFITVDIGSPE